MSTRRRLFSSVAFIEKIKYMDNTTHEVTVFVKRSFFNKKKKDQRLVARKTLLTSYKVSFCSIWDIFSSIEW